MFGYSVPQALAFLRIEGELERQRLAQLVGVVAVAAQGEKRSIEQLQRDLSKE
ncbi:MULTISPECIES: hypothetical protein [Hydrogenophaga]|uniref:Uncharacterized protein n=1 Tax=Hydrogenophaga intermedia TaxID=65786 RepID=A0A1L1PGU5_HYDIT|nr:MULTISPECIES: hypothetical protein [Hydrogenophaga]CDN87009.1 hypothetical protein BN948_01428 [Hydrogenophaga intermedia]